jgi:hypothetical protein
LAPRPKNSFYRSPGKCGNPCLLPRCGRGRTTARARQRLTDPRVALVAGRPKKRSPSHIIITPGLYAFYRRPNTAPTWAGVVVPPGDVPVSGVVSGCAAAQWGFPAGWELAKFSHSRRPCAVTVIRCGVMQLAYRGGAPRSERGGRRWGRFEPWWMSRRQAALPLEAGDEIVEAARVVDVKPALFLAPVAEMHDRTDVKESLLAVNRRAEALDGKHMVVTA